MSAYARSSRFEAMARYGSSAGRDRVRCEERRARRDRRRRPGAPLLRLLGCCVQLSPRERRPRPPKPVATTVTQTWPVSRSSTVAPKMMFVSSVAAPRITSAASFTSTSVRSSPPAIERRMPRAPVISASISGERSARSAASRARPSRSDEEKPMPISAVSESDMIVRTSAKSRLIRPGIVIRSQMPWTPWRRTSSATLNASSIDVERSSTSSSRSFGITIVVSQAARRARRSRSRPGCGASCLRT